MKLLHQELPKMTIPAEAVTGDESYRRTGNCDRNERKGVILINYLAQECPYFHPPIHYDLKAYIFNKIVEFVPFTACLYSGLMFAKELSSEKFRFPMEKY